MFGGTVAELDRLIEADDFVEITTFVAGIPKWKLIPLYLCTFFYKDGKQYRKCIGYLKFPYYLMYKLLTARFKEFICGKSK